MGLIVDPGSIARMPIADGEVINVVTRQSATLRAVSGMSKLPGAVIATANAGSRIYGPFSAGVFEIQANIESAIVGTSPGGVASESKVATPGNRYAYGFDSLAQFGSAGASGTATAVGNIATVVLTNHGEAVGNTVTLHLSQNNIQEYHGIWQVATVQSKDVFTVILRDTPPGPAGTIAVANTNRSFSSASIDQAVNFRLGGALNFVINAGIGGDTTSQVLARLDNDVIAFTPNFCRVMIGTNDIRYVQTVAAKDAAVANIIQICQRLMDAGITPVLCTILPVGIGDQGFSIVTPLIVAANVALANYASATPGVLFADTFSAMVDNAATDNRALSTCLSDNVHINAIGANLVSFPIANCMEKYVSNPLPLVAGNADTVALSAGSTNRLNNPLFITSGGTANAGITGTVANNWAATAGGSCTAVASLVPRTIADDGDKRGNNQHVVATATALDDNIKLRTIQTISQYKAGDTIFFDAAFAMRSASNVKFALWDLEVYMAGQTYHMYVDAGSSLGFPSAEVPTRGVKRSGRFKLPYDATDVKLSLQVQFLGAGSATYDIGLARIGVVS